LMPSTSTGSGKTSYGTSSPRPVYGSRQVTPGRASDSGRMGYINPGTYTATAICPPDNSPSISYNAPANSGQATGSPASGSMVYSNPTNYSVSGAPSAPPGSPAGDNSSIVSSRPVNPTYTQTTISQTDSGVPQFIGADACWSNYREGGGITIGEPSAPPKPAAPAPAPAQPPAPQIQIWTYPVWTYHQDNTDWPSLLQHIINLLERYRIIRIRNMGWWDIRIRMRWRRSSSSEDEPSEKYRKEQKRRNDFGFSPGGGRGGGSSSSGGSSR